MPFPMEQIVRVIARWGGDIKLGGTAIIGFRQQRSVAGPDDDKAVKA